MRLLPTTTTTTTLLFALPLLIFLPPAHCNDPSLPHDCSMYSDNIKRCVYATNTVQICEGGNWRYYEKCHGRSYCDDGIITAEEEGRYGFWGKAGDVGNGKAECVVQGWDERLTIGGKPVVGGWPVGEE
ncbi:hypothetical protein G6011_11710 [Alternaria panax]|uniref:Uncharacterized protein n=1 Tax=Alternaria panax TaxID=48097 RepID=A0AAD4IEJ3_9PLEO|nr:hypothetical protein G6011_11710 [Alternaria panax]